MAQNAATLEAGSYAEMYPALGHRNTLLALVGYYAGVTALTAANAIAGAKAQGYAALSEKDLFACLLQVLFSSVALPVPVLVAESTNTLGWSVGITVSFWNLYISTNGGTSYTLLQQLAGNASTIHFGGAGQSGNKAYITGIASDGITPLTQNSNVVTVP